MSLVSIVVPVYHNAASLPELLARLQEVAGKNPADAFEFVFVDDGSRDDSYAVLRDLAVREKRLVVVKLSRNFGSNAALLAGLEESRGDAVGAVSADLQDPPELLHEMISRWRAGKRVVLAARASREDPFPASLLSNLFYALFRRFAIPAMPRGGFDFFLVDRRVRDLVVAARERNTYLMGLLLWVGFEPDVLTYHRRERESRFGRSMWSLKKKLNYFIDSFVAFSYVPVRAASLLGITVSVLGLLYAVFVVGAWLVRGIPVAGWTSLMVALLVVSGAQLLMIGVLGEYLWRNLDETRARPPFIVESVLRPGEIADPSSPG